MSRSEYELDIEKYTFNDILELFKITKCDIDENDIKSAKKQVFLMHPDKSRLPSKYFIFYKKAYDILIEYYKENNKVNNIVPTEAIEYENINTSKSDSNSSYSSGAHKVINSIPTKDFNVLFNKLFEREMIPKDVSDKNDWFKSEDKFMDRCGDINKVSPKEMDATFNVMRERNSNIVKYTGNVKCIRPSSNVQCENIHGDNDGEYVCSNMFSKLGYDDLRKVHKDEVIFSVGEKDLENISRFKNIDDYKNDANNYEFIPEIESLKMIKSKNDKKQEEMLNKEFLLKAKIRGYEEKNKSIIASFLHLTDR